MSELIKKVKFPPIVQIASQALSLAPKDKKLISFGQGVAFFGPPKYILEKTLDEWKNPDHFVHRYNLDQGLSSLRETIAEFERKRYQLPELNPNKEIMITAGANQACYNAIKALCSPGDEVIIFSPFYFNHEMAIAMEGLKLNLVPVNIESLTIDIEELEKSITSRTKLLIYVNPNNPTGVLETKETLLKIFGLLEKHPYLWFLSDETYAEFIYNTDITGPFYSAGAIENNCKDRIIIVRSFSKAWGMAGWRLGYLIYPMSLNESLLKIQDTIVVSSPVPSQLLGEACLKWSDGINWLEEKIQKINEVRMYLMNNLIDNSFFKLDKNSSTGQSAFYIFPKLFLPSNKNSDQFVENLVRQEGVLILPGSAFGVQWKKNVRISFGNVSMEQAMEGIERINNFSAFY
ncbi:MAG: putative N-acetyl-LL-diaminopimelate aminotransferase [Candidatus Heimdallarchaeota archaeon LC_3]|nr:MAG: putative N-acetyl-LL-diaminopimelate aminotransferase [Candidatus Heimdallarchaeota archaeon LC_3]